MGLTLNPLTGQLDIRGSGGGGGGGSQTPNFVHSFDATTDWGAPSSGLYTLTVTAVSHGKGTNPIVNVLEEDGSDFLAVGMAYKLNASGDVILEVLETPDNRFAGKLIIAENN